MPNDKLNIQYFSFYYQNNIFNEFILVKKEDKEKLNIKNENKEINNNNLDNKDDKIQPKKKKSMINKIPQKKPLKKIERIKSLPIPKIQSKKDSIIQKTNKNLPKQENKQKDKKSQEIKKEKDFIKEEEIKKETKEEEKKFRATPIISPIFGVLDKNYIPSEVATRKGGNYEINRHSKNIDFDSVRKKAYESNKTLEDDIRDNMLCENCEYLKKAKECKKKSRVDRQEAYDALCEKDEQDDITLDEAAENYFDYGVAYEKKQDIDPIYLDEEKENSVKIVNHEENQEKKEKNKDIPPVKSSINLLSTIKKSMGEEEKVEEDNNKEKDLELTDDLFNLIDSMYEDKEE